jgi:hypothetical protein
VNNYDGKTLKARLSELADALGGKAPGEAGIKAWTVSLQDFPIEEVVAALDLWLQTKTKMPAPADIRQILAGRLSDRIEAKAQAEKAEYEAGATRILSEVSRGIGREYLAKIRDILAKSRGNPGNGDTWWHALILKWRAGEPLVWMQMVNARKAWEKSGKPAEWAPRGESEAEREAAEERRCIQAEGA